jgi:hypothetical protein
MAYNTPTYFGTLVPSSGTWRIKFKTCQNTVEYSRNTRYM